MTAKVSYPEEITLEKGAEIKRALKDMLASEGWAYYISVIEKQQTIRLDQVVLQPLAGHDAVFQQEFMKGEIQGLRMAVSLPQTLIEACELAVEQLKAEQGDENENE